jgi:two-component system, NtrC family, response regulator AtoC
MKDAETSVPPTILVLDDESDFVEDCKTLLERRGYRCLTASDSLQGLDLACQHRPQVVLTDLRMPRVDGLGVLEKVKAMDREIIVILITGYPTAQSAVQATQSDAFDYLAKPFTAAQLYAVVQRGLEHQQRRRHIDGSSARSPEFEASELVGTSAPMRRVLDLLKQVARVHLSVLITGESGTGKEMVARAIHRNSIRGNKPFVPVDCVAIPESLMESELFGHGKGAFTDAHIARPGLFETASGGTLFVDEVGDLGASTQAKLLRVLENTEVRRLGEREFRRIDVRIISATNKKLTEMVATGEFREDLYYRLNVIPIHLPPLRERSVDIPLLAEHFLRQFCEASGKVVRWISASALMLMRKYHWPGNVRELRNVIERAAALTNLEYITPLDLPEGLIQVDAELDDLISTLPFREEKGKLIEAFEQEYLTKLLAMAEGNVTQAARLAGMARTAFQRLLKKYNIKSEDFSKYCPR